MWARPAVAHPRDGDDAYARGLEQLRSDEYDRAAASFVAAFRAGEREQEAAYNAACAYALAGKTDMAFLWLDRAYQIGFDLSGYLDRDRDLGQLRGDPRFGVLESRVARGAPARQAREGAHTVERWNALRGRTDARADEFDRMGRELLEAGRYEEAAQAFAAVAARDERHATALYNEACARARQGQTAVALDLLQRAVEDGFTDRDQLSEDDDLASLRQDPRFAQLLALADELDAPGYVSGTRDRQGKRQREWKDALPRLEAATRSHPQLGKAWENLGLAYLILGRPADAIAPFDRAVELGFRKSTSLYNLACAASLSGHKDEAYAWLDKALSAGFSNWWLLREDPDLDAIRTDPRFAPYLATARAHEQDDGELRVGP
jgi:tetratricopeptide (TPR) repeat protein